MKIWNISKEFKNIVSSNNENEFLYTSKSPIVIINKDKTLKLTISRENKDLNYILYANQSISILPEEKIKIHKALKELSNFSFLNLITNEGLINTIYCRLRFWWKLP